MWIAGDLIDWLLGVVPWLENGPLLWNPILLLQAITSSGIKKGEVFVADVNTQLKNKNITTDIKVDTDSNVSSPFSCLDVLFCYSMYCLVSDLLLVRIMKPILVVEFFFIFLILRCRVVFMAISICWFIFIFRQFLIVLIHAISIVAQV